MPDAHIFPLESPSAFDSMTGGAHKEVKIVADGHRQRQQFFERLLGLIERDGHSASLQPDTLGEVVELLRQNLHGCFYQQLRPFQAILVKLRQDLGDLAATPPLVIPVVAFG